MNTNEIWKELNDFNGQYLVSSLGRLKSLPNSRHKIERFIEGNINHKGYLMVRLSLNGFSKMYSKHRLIAQTFILNPYNYDQINHIDENKLNNAVNNLEWCSNKQNCNHGTRTLRMKNTKHSKNQWVKKPVVAIKNGKVAMRFSSTNRVTKYGLLQDAVCRCCNHKKGYKSYKGYIWEYEENYYR